MLCRVTAMPKSKCSKTEPVFTGSVLLGSNSWKSKNLHFRNDQGHADSNDVRLAHAVGP
jgi:hypothetical protein